MSMAGVLSLSFESFEPDSIEAPIWGYRISHTLSVWRAPVTLNCAAEIEFITTPLMMICSDSRMFNSMGEVEEHDFKLNLGKGRIKTQ